jgi:uncharacterized membrane protein
MLPGATSSVANAVNTAGVIVGVSRTEMASQAVMWDRRGRIHQLASTGALYEKATAVNAEGTILGDTSDPVNDVRDVAVWDKHGGLVDLAFPPDMVHPGGLGGINDHGTIIGSMYVSQDDQAGRGLRWNRPDRPIDLASLFEDDYSGVIAINEHDVAIGVSYTSWRYRAVYWDRAGRVHALAMLPDSEFSMPMDINDHGVVIGICSYPQPNRNRAVLWHVDRGRD